MFTHGLSVSLVTEFEIKYRLTCWIIKNKYYVLIKNYISHIVLHSLGGREACKMHWNYFD